MKMMSRRPLVLFTSCIIISLCRGVVKAFIPSTSRSIGLNLPPLLKGTSSANKYTIITQQHDNIHALKSSSLKSTASRLWAATASDNDDNSNNNSPSNEQSSSTKKNKTNKRPMSISKQSLTPAQKSNSLPQQQQQAKAIKEDDDPINDKDEQRAYNELLPKTGYSLADSLEQSLDNKELFETVLTPIAGVYSGIGGGGLLNVDDDGVEEFEYDVDGFPIAVKKKENNNSKKNEIDTNEENDDGGHDGIARIDTISNFGGMEPVRWIVSLGDKHDVASSSSSHVMIDLPPYSDKLANEIRQFMNPDFNTTTTIETAASGNESNNKGTLDAILLTNQQCIHYDNSPGVYVTRKSDLTKWKKAFPEAKVVMYRLDIPRECREEVTQVLDGYGPWGWKEEEEDEGGEKGGLRFVETGRPLTIEEWDEDTKSRVLKNGELPPDDGDVLDSDGESVDTDDGVDYDEDAMYSENAIRQREEEYRLLAVYTPGHTFGSVTYIFPKRNLCCSGFALPLESSSPVGNYDEDEDDDDNNGRSSSSSLPPIGPRLDYQGYLATSASRPRQMSSALSLINRYIDRFRVVLPARGDIVFLDSDEERRKRDLMESVGLYRKMSDIYSRLGIVE
ncbi:hypothetical protein ACHAXM_001818 [Skeletonema potamos]